VIVRTSSFIALTSLVLVSAACGGSEEAAQEATTTVADTALLSAQAVEIGQFSLVGVEESEWRDAWHAPARLTLDPASTQPLGSVVEGRVLEVRVFPGDRVTEGQPLALIHSHEVMDARQRLIASRGAARAADSAATVATNAAARAERLLAAKAMSSSDVERARSNSVAAVAAREAADAEAIRAEGFLEHLIGHGDTDGIDDHAAVVRAPFAGVVTGRQVQPGQVVLIGQPLLTVARESVLGVQMNLPEEAIASIAPDVQVRFKVPAYRDRIFDARVTRISPVVDSMSRAVEVWARISGDGQRLLRAEMTADAELIGARGAKVLAVPASAVQMSDGDTIVVVASHVGEGLLIESRPVRIGRRTSLLVEILGGVAKGDSVLDRGAAIGKAEIAKRRGGGEGADH
jgi:RND family efflux transporter MFP subunit